MRVSICLLFALLSCSCSAVRYQSCGDAVPNLGPHGRTIISDIDDTIKDTHVKLGRTHIPNPSILLDGLRPWHPVAGMASTYARNWGPYAEYSPEHGWRKGKTSTIIYLSSGPCRYRSRLRRVIPEWNFPNGPIVLRSGGPIAPRDYKTIAIARIIEASPGHHFILVGDSGEHDPDCYGDLARKFSRQVDGIYIRDISADTRSHCKQVLHDIPWKKIHFL
jgi:phosphatidate phosphatase APP1